VIEQQTPIGVMDRVKLSVMCCGLGTVVKINVEWQGRHDAIKVVRDMETGDGLLYWPHELRKTKDAKPPLSDRHLVRETIAWLMECQSWFIEKNIDYPMWIEPEALARALKGIVNKQEK